MNAYLKIALRSLYREKLYALINIAGLSLAIACCIFLGLYLRSELTYDQHNVLHNKIYRVVNEFYIGGSDDRFAVTSVALGQMLAENYPEVENYTRFRPVGQDRSLMRHDVDAVYWDRVYFADDNVFDVFTHDVIYGDPDTALVDPGSIAVSETFARRYFGDANPIGETMINDVGRPMNITLVFADLPDNTHLKYDVLFSPYVNVLQTPDNTTARRQALFNVALYTYLVMPENYDVQDFNAISEDFFDDNMASMAETFSATWRGWLQPLADIHLQSDLDYDQPTGNRYYLYGFAAVGLFILLVACINYVNLATARAGKRARAVGIRKILGSGRWSLVGQFLGEAVLLSVIAAVIGVMLVEVVLTFSPLENLVSAQLTLDLIDEPAVAAAILGFAVIIGALAGLYPAIYLSSWAPLTALVGENKASKGNIRFRQLLVLTQFAISIAVIASTLLMAAQMRFIQNKSLGFQTENRVMITLRGADLIEKVPTITSNLLTDSHILGISTSGSMMGQAFPINVVQVETNEGVLEPRTINHMGVGDDFLEVMGIPVSEGRDFSKKLLTDIGKNVIVNRTFVDNMGWADPLGKRIQLGSTSGRVIGVIEDFHFKSLHSAIEPFAFYPFDRELPEAGRPAQSRLLVLNIAGEEISQTLRLLEDTFAEVDPSRPFEFTFVDDSLNELYVSEQALMTLIGIFAGICILIACLGLYGLAAFTTEQRTKEIGIRKVIGASTGQIILLLSRNVLTLVLAGAVIGSVGAYFTIDEWLAGFAYRAGINPIVFFASTLVAALVAFLTIALQSFGTARADPVDALRYE